jgi:hypothetical protein
MQIVIRRFAIALSLVCMLPLVACGGGADTAPPTPSAPVGGTVTLGASSFQQTSISVSAGQALRLVDAAATGGTHMLCLGAAQVSG